MSTQSHFFFQNIGKPKIEISNDEKHYQYNCLILEIATNWNFILDLMNKYKDGKLSEVDIIEKDWFNFIIKNKIDVFGFREPEKFVEYYFKINKL